MAPREERKATHKARMVARRERQIARRSDYPKPIKVRGQIVGFYVMPGVATTKSDSPSWRKSIWPAAKVARRLASAA